MLNLVQKWCDKAGYLKYHGLYPNNENENIYCVYIVLDLNCKNNITLMNMTFEYDIKYIGMGLYDKTTSMRRKRPFVHRNDLLNDNLLLDKSRYGIYFPSITLDKYSAYQLESYLIDAALNKGYSLTKRKVRNLETPKMQLWNKIRGHKLNGNHIRKVA